MSQKKEDSTSTLSGQTCPMCRKNTLTLLESESEVPFFGKLFLFSMTCGSCKYHKAAVEAAEQHEPMPAMAAEWRTSLPPTPAPGNPSLSEGDIEEIARRVLGRLSDRVVRDTVAKLVSAVAERLVREEIDRIKGAIK